MPDKDQVPAPRSSPTLKSVGNGAASIPETTGVHVLATHGWVRHMANIKMAIAIVGGAVLGLLGTGATFNSWVVTSASKTAKDQVVPISAKYDELRDELREHKAGEADWHLSVASEIASNRREAREDSHALYQAILTRRPQKRLEADGGM
jgi:hypothetical protein